MRRNARKGTSKGTSKRSSKGSSKRIYKRASKRVTRKQSGGNIRINMQKLQENIKKRSNASALAAISAKKAKEFEEQVELL